MAGRNYDKLPIEEFGKHLLESGDLDPIYIALVKLRDEGNMGRLELYRWLVAYWCFYSAGVACHMASFKGVDYWHEMWIAAENNQPSWAPGERWPRGHERRHFRGAAATTAVDKLRARFKEPEQIVSYIITGKADHLSRQTIEVPIPFGTITGRAQELPLFGPWISFKIADMTDRVLKTPVDFSTGDVFMFTDPTKAALKLWCLKMSLPETAKPKDEQVAIGNVVSYLTKHFSTHKAPPMYDRLVGLQEVETILCKWKSHCNGHYPLNNDIDEINEGVKPWAANGNQLAAEFLDAMPKRLLTGNVSTAA